MEGMGVLDTAPVGYLNNFCEKGQKKQKTEEGKPARKKRRMEKKRNLKKSYGKRRMTQELRGKVQREEEREEREHAESARKLPFKQKYLKALGIPTRNIQKGKLTYPSFSMLIMSKFTTSKTFIALSSPTEQNNAPSELAAMLSTMPMVVKPEKKH